jgi:radical SAM-linked protein
MRGDAGFPLRVRFTKRGRVRFVSHRDVARAFERAFRIERLPLAFTQGFAPRPKVSFGLALSVGHESDAEYLDFELTHEPVTLSAVGGELSGALPEGIDVTGLGPLAERAPALQEAVTAVEYDVEVVDAFDAGPPKVEAVSDVVGAALASPTLVTTRTRKGRELEEDVRPAIRRLEVAGATETGVLLRLEVSTQPRGARPGEIVSALRAGLAERRVLRTRQWIERGGARLEPLEADPRLSVLSRTDSRAPEVRAS